MRSFITGRLFFRLADAVLYELNLDEFSLCISPNGSVSGQYRLIFPGIQFRRTSSPIAFESSQFGRGIGSAPALLRIPHKRKPRSYWRAKFPVIIKPATLAFSALYLSNAKFCLVQLLYVLVASICNYVICPNN